MKYSVLAVALWSGIFFMHTAFGGKIAIELKETVTLPEREILLGDIAYISCSDSSCMEKLNKISLGNTPWPGNVRKIKKEIINARLLDEGILLPDVVYGDKEFSLVSVETITIKGNEIFKKAKEHLLSTMSRPEDEIVIEADRMPRDILVPAHKGALSFEVSQIGANKDRGSVQFIVRVFINDKQYQKIPVYFMIRVFDHCVVANRLIQRNEIFSQEDISIRRVETTRLTEIPFDTVKEIVGKRALYTIRENTPITEKLIDDPPVIKKGDFIKLFIHTGKLRVVTKGVAMEEGYLGKVIRVKSFDSNKELHGTVEDLSAVRIIY